MRHLWTATVGSHMWKMNHEGSDTDLFSVSIQDIEEILSGHQIRKGKEDKYEDIELTSYEIGHVIEQLQKGNINFLWGLFSPIYHYSGKMDECLWVHTTLRSIVRANLSKNFIHAIKGMVRNNLKKYYGIEVEEKDGIIDFKQVSGCNIEETDYKYYKKIKMMYRSLLQGYILLSKKKFEFPTVVGKINLLDLQMFYKGISIEYEKSDLPIKPDPKPYNDFIVKIRLRLAGLRN